MAKFPIFTKFFVFGFWLIIHFVLEQILVLGANPKIEKFVSEPIDVTGADV